MLGIISRIGFSNLQIATNVEPAPWIPTILFGMSYTRRWNPQLNISPRKYALSTAMNETKTTTKMQNEKRSWNPKPDEIAV